jgi:hypothetical protein
VDKQIGFLSYVDTQIGTQGSRQAPSGAEIGLLSAPRKPIGIYICNLGILPSSFTIFYKNNIIPKKIHVLTESLVVKLTRINSRETI